MSYTLELLRMETEHDFWRQQHQLRHPRPGGQRQQQPRRCAECAVQAAQVPCVSAKTSSAAGAGHDTAAGSSPPSDTHCAKVLSHHSYYDCCINVHVSALLEHWLDWDRPPCRCHQSQEEEEETPTAEVAAAASAPTRTTDTAKSLSLSSSDHHRRYQQQQQHQEAVDLSRLTLHDILTSQLDKGTTTTSAGSGSRCGGLSGFTRRHFSSSRGCDDDNFFSDLLLGEVGRGQGELLLRLAEEALDEMTHARRERVAREQMPQLRHLLRRGFFSEATLLAGLLLDRAPSSVHSAEPDNGRTLLSYSVEYADRSADLTRLLLNHGAKVWPVSERERGSDGESSEEEEDLVQRLTRERETSAFTWFLRGAMARCASGAVAAVSGGAGARRESASELLSDAEETLRLLGSSMGEEPTRMRRHVTRTMMHLGRGASLNGALFLQLRLRLSPWWREPQQLRHQCARRVRRSLGTKRLNDDRALDRLGLPPKLRRYVKMQEPL